MYYLLDLRDKVSLETLLGAVPRGKEKRASMFYPLNRGSRRRKGVELARRRMIRIMQNILQDIPDAYLRLSGRMYVYVTAWPWFHSRVICQWSSNEDLMHTFLATSCIPGIATRFEPVCCYAGWFVDGGFVSTHPVRDCRTVCVSTQPFTQWWAKAYHVKKHKWPEISRRLDSSKSLEVERRSFYRKMHHWGQCDASAYLHRRVQKHLCR